MMSVEHLWWTTGVGFAVVYTTFSQAQKRLAEAQALIQVLKEEVENLKRGGKRQAVPFARRERVEKPKKRDYKPAAP